MKLPVSRAGGATIWGRPCPRTSPTSKFSRHMPARGRPSEISSKRNVPFQIFGVTTAASLAGSSTIGLRSSGSGAPAFFGSGFGAIRGSEDVVRLLVLAHDGESRPDHDGVEETSVLLVIQDLLRDPEELLSGLRVHDRRRSRARRSLLPARPPEPAGRGAPSPVRLALRVLGGLFSLRFRRGFRGGSRRPRGRAAERSSQNGRQEGGEGHFHGKLLAAHGTLGPSAFGR